MLNKDLGEDALHFFSDEMASQKSSMIAHNKVYISREQQEKIGEARILLAGAGISSIIAESLVRIGFKNFTVIERGLVELSNLNTQNYTYDDIGKAKVDALFKRLKNINPLANIRIENILLTEENVRQYILNHDIAINTIDFKSNLPFIFDEICWEENIPVLHPYNFGWASALLVFMPKGETLYLIEPYCNNFEQTVVKYVIKYCKTYLDSEVCWLQHALKKNADEQIIQLPLQLSVGSSFAAALCTRVACCITLNKPVKSFPEIYYCGT